MKKIFMSGFISLGLLLSINVNAACGDINAISTDVGTIKKSNNTTYILSVPKGVKSVNISASASGDWVKGYGPRTIPTSNQTRLVVDGTSCGGGSEYTYYINIEQVNEVLAANDAKAKESQASTQSESQSTEATTNVTTKNEVFLKNIVVTGYDIEFNKDKDTYVLEVENEVDRVEINAEKEDANDTVEISSNAKALEVGENKIVITVSNAAGKKGQYILIVKRKGELDNNTYLSNIIIEGYDLNFDQEKTSYTLTIGNETSLDITATTASKKATKRIKGNNDLKDGSTITITVTAENGSTKRNYKIHIKKKFNVMDYAVYIAIGGLIFLLFILLLVRKSKRKKKAKAAAKKNSDEDIETLKIDDNKKDKKTKDKKGKEKEKDTVLKIDGSLDPNNVGAKGNMKEIKPSNVETSDKNENTEMFKI